MKSSSSTVKIFTENIHPGIPYTLEVMSTISGWKIEWIDEIPENGEEEEIILSYSKEPVEGLPLLTRSGFWENMSDFPIEEVSQGSLKGLFPVYKGMMSIDLIAFVFWSVSRVEEYKAYETDKYGRFPATSSWAFQNEMLYRPFIDEWVHLWQLKMRSVFPELDLPERRTINCATFDFDYPYLFKYKSLGSKLKTLGGAFVKGNWSLFGKYLRGNDPFNTFGQLLDDLKQHQLSAHFFFLANNASVKEDRTTPLENPHYQKIIRDYASKGEIGIHPSILSHNIPGQLQEEIRRLEKVSDLKVEHSRSHYLKLQIPDTYRKLIKAGIRHDHSMGFADRPGFRAGTAYPFYWYDLGKNRPTSLKVHPLLIMDATFRFYLKCSPDEALAIIDNLQENMTTTGGHFTWLWHNTSFSRAHGWKNWRKVYQKLLTF